MTEQTTEIAQAPRTPMVDGDTLDLMKREIDALQVAVAEKAKPWYKNMSTVLSIVAMVFSFGTTFVSYRRTAEQDVLSARQDLRNLLQRLAALPKENVEISKKFSGDTASQSLVSGFINQENTLLARQAAELARSLPPSTVSAIEYQAVAVALQNAYDLSGASEFLKLALDAKVDFNSEISTRRTLANLHFLLGRAEAGRDEYRRALDIFATYPSYDSYTKISTNVHTELAWAYSEANAGWMPQATSHLQAADGLIGTLQPSPGSAMLRAQVAQTRAVFSGNQAPTPFEQAPISIQSPPELTRMQ